MATSYTNPSKGSTSYGNPGMSDYLLKQDESLLLQQNGDPILLNQAISYSQDSKNSTSYTNPSKN